MPACPLTPPPRPWGPGLRSAGQFLDLVERKFYDGMEVQRADGFVVQVGGGRCCSAV